MRWKLFAAGLALLLLAALGHGCTSSVRQCAELPQERSPNLVPRRLSETGWRESDPALKPYRPRFELWSDGATKRRWLYLPPSTAIDIRNVDSWRFPVGTKLWKEFTRDGVRVETRMLHKYGPGDADWAVMAYVWNADQTDAIAAPEGRENANGTPHDVPSARMCNGCHGGTMSRVLGVSAIQADESLLADIAPGTHEVTLPGEPPTRAALGYLHANCSHCHNQSRPEAKGPRCYDPQRPFDFALRVGELATPESTATYRTALKLPGPTRILDRFSGGSRFKPRMPYLGTETVDPAGQALLRQWLATVR